MQLDRNDRSARTMRILGYAGLLPFALLLLIAVFANGQLALQATASMLFYAAMILTFVGAVHWGSVLSAADNNDAEQKRLYWAVTPSLLGWLALMLSAPWSIVLLVTAFLLCWWVDRKFYLKAGLLWYQSMRNHLTFAVVAALVALLFFSWF